jgi:hypothetical protein
MTEAAIKDTASEIGFIAEVTISSISVSVVTMFPCFL